MPGNIQRLKEIVIMIHFVVCVVEVKSTLTLTVCVVDWRTAR